MIRNVGNIISPYMNYGNYGGYGYTGGRYGSYLGTSFGSDFRTGTGSRTTARNHTLAINDSDSASTKLMKEAINRVNAAGAKPQNARGTTGKTAETDSKTEKWSDLNKALKRMDADDIRELYTMMRTAFGGAGSFGGLF